MPDLPKLKPDSSATVAIQRTTLSLDALARSLANTLDEALEGNDRFDVIVIGSGMYGAYAASKFFRLGGASRPRVLVLEAGPFVLAEHVQNFSARLGYDVFREVYGQPYSAKILEGGAANRAEPVANHYYCVGGKSLGWGKWCPRLTDQDLLLWPLSVAEALRNEYPIVELELGVKPESDFIYGPLYDALFARAATVMPAVSDFTRVIPPPIAAQSGSAASGLYSFDAFSSVALLLDAIRDDIALHGPTPAGRKLVLVPNCRAYLLEMSEQRITSIRVVNGTDAKPRTVAVHGADIYLAMGSIESTRIVLHSIGPTDPQSRLIGRNLMVHLRTDFDVRIRRDAFHIQLPERLEAAALQAEGEVDGRRFHVQLFAAADRGRNAEVALYKMLPDIDDLETLLSNQVDGWVTIRAILCGEVRGSTATPLYANNSCWMDLSPYDADYFGGVRVPRAFVQFALTTEDDDHWLKIHERALSLLEAIADGPQSIEFRHADGSWSHVRPTRDNLRSFRKSLGSTYHEAGMMWMGDDPNTSVTNTSGRLHQFQNLYCVDQAVFPTVGSANPVLTGMALARKFVRDSLGRGEPDVEWLRERLASRIENEAWRLENGQPIDEASIVRVLGQAEILVDRDRSGVTPIGPHALRGVALAFHTGAEKAAISDPFDDSPPEAGSTRRLVTAIDHFKQTIRDRGSR